MSFLRPELTRRLLPWREAGIWASLCLLGLWLAWRGLGGGGGLAAVLGICTAGAAGAFLHAALRRRRVRAEAPAEGVAQIVEGRIGYWGPWSGGFLDLGALSRVDMVTDGRRQAWQLVGADGRVLRIPIGAIGAERVYDALAASRPLDEEALKAALAARRAACFPIWVADGGAPAGGIDGSVNPLDRLP